MRWIAVVAMLVAGPVWAKEPAPCDYMDDPMRGVCECREEEDVLKRLACYDLAVKDHALSLSHWEDALVETYRERLEWDPVARRAMERALAGE